MITVPQDLLLGDIEVATSNSHFSANKNSEHISCPEIKARKDEEVSRARRMDPTELSTSSTGREVSLDFYIRQSDRIR